MNRISNIFRVLKTAKIMVFGVVFACVFHGDLHAAQAAYRLGNICDVVSGTEGVEAKLRLVPSMSMKRAGNYLLALSYKGMPGKILPCRFKYVLISKACKESTDCPAREYGLWMSNNALWDPLGAGLKISQCPDDKIPTDGVWEDRTSGVLGAVSGRTYYVREGHAYRGSTDDDTFFIFPDEELDQYICWTDGSGKMAGTCEGTISRKIDAALHTYWCEDGYWLDVTGRGNADYTKVTRCTEEDKDWCTPAPDDANKCDIEKGLTVFCTSSRSADREPYRRVFKLEKTAQSWRPVSSEEWVLRYGKNLICKASCEEKVSESVGGAKSEPAPVPEPEPEPTTAPVDDANTCNTQQEKDGLGASEIEKSGDLCVAKICKPNHYMVKNNNAYQGWCYAISCPSDQEPNIDAQDMWEHGSEICRAKQSAETEVVQETTEQPVVAEGSPTETVAPSGPVDGDDCKSKKYMADVASYQNGDCIVHECYKGYEVKDNECTEISGPCESLPDNATRGHREYDKDADSVKCIVDDCVDGYVIAEDKLSCHEDYDALAKQAREREQSFENKLIGAVGMGATGIGGSMLLSGMSETKSDEDAERAMKAYLETFTCKYGNESVPGGTMNVEIPGGNELIQMYADYVALANDLKVRKAALGMAPGIESEAILDSATSGLYDDVSTGKTKGAYASLARALSDPNSEDAKIWAAQREESEEKKKTGAIVAGIGAIGSLVANVSVNKIDWKSKRNKALRDLEDDVANITPARIRCPSDAHGTYYPDCTCKDSNKVYNANMNRCDACPSGHVVVNGICECPQNTHEVNGECVDITAVKDAVEYLGNKMLGVLEDKAVLPADNLFEYGSDVLTPEARNKLEDFISRLGEAGATSCVPQVDGYADPSGKPEYNLDLSKRRAESVATYLKNNSSGLIDVVKSEGYGEDSCTCGLSAKVTQTINWDDQDYRVCKDKEGDYSVSDNNKSSRYAPCRRVEIKPGCVVGAPNREGLLNAVAETLGS